MAEDVNTRINAALDSAKEAMLDSGMDEGTADALLFSARPSAPTFVGNLADVHRLGRAMVHEDAGIGEHFVEPPPLPGEVILNQMATGRADGYQTDGPVTEARQAARDAGGGVAVVGGGTDLASMSKADLQGLADQRGVDYTSRTTKEELVSALGG